MDATADSNMVVESGDPYATIPPKPERGRKKLILEQRQPATTDIATLRQQICDHKRKCQEQLQSAYRDNLTELFYLQNGLNYMDIANWRKKPNLNLNHYLKSYSLDPPADEPIKSEPIATSPLTKSGSDIKTETPQLPATR